MPSPRPISAHSGLQKTIDEAWENRNALSTQTGGEIRDAVYAAVENLDNGSLRIAEKIGKEWIVNQWAKKAVLLYLRITDMQLIEGAAGSNSHWFDKVVSKFEGWDDATFRRTGFRAVSGCIVRKGAFIAKDAVLMPSFVNIGAYVGEGTMIDTWATVGSCAQIGKHCHISGGTGIGGVLEPLQANPVIIEDNCFIGARSEIAEGVIVEEGAVISMGVFIGASTKIIDRESGEVIYGRVPAYSVVVPGTLPGKTPDAPALACAVIVKKVDEKTRSKTGINDLLRGI